MGFSEGIDTVLNLNGLDYSQLIANHMHTPHVLFYRRVFMCAVVAISQDWIIIYYRLSVCRCLCLCLSVCLPVCLSVCLFLFRPDITVMVDWAYNTKLLLLFSVCLSVSLCLSLCLSLSVSLSLSLSTPPPTPTPRLSVLTYHYAAVSGVCPQPLPDRQGLQLAQPHHRHRSRLRRLGPLQLHCAFTLSRPPQEVPPPDSALTGQSVSV